MSFYIFEIRDVRYIGVSFNEKRDSIPGLIEERILTFTDCLPEINTSLMIHECNKYCF